MLKINRAHFLYAASLLIFSAGAQSGPTIEVLRDTKFQNGFVFGVTEHANTYVRMGRKVTNSGLLAIDTTAGSLDPYNYERLYPTPNYTNGETNIMYGANRIGRPTDVPSWSTRGYGAFSTTPYSSAHDYVTGQPLGGTAACPENIAGTGMCRWKGTSINSANYPPANPDPNPVTLISLEAGRNSPTRDADIKYRINEVGQYTTWEKDNYWGQCASIPAGFFNYQEASCKDSDGVPIQSGKLHFQTEGSSGVPSYFSGGNRLQGEHPVSQIFAANLNVGNIQKLAFTGEVKLKRRDRINYTTSGVHICSDAESAAGKWDSTYNRYINCYKRLIMNEHGIQSTVFSGITINHSPADMAVFDMGFSVQEIKTGKHLFLGLISSVDWFPDTHQSKDGLKRWAVNSSECTASRSSTAAPWPDLSQPSSWVCNSWFDPYSGYFIKLPSFVFYNANRAGTGVTFPSIAQLTPATEEDLGGGTYTLNTQNVFESNWIQFGTAGQEGIDLIPWIQMAVNDAATKGFLTSTNLSDYRLAHLGFSLEQGGPVDTEVLLKNLSLKATLNENPSLGSPASWSANFIK